MTSSQSEPTAFTNLLQFGQARRSRRDFLRVSAMSSVAATMPFGGIYAAQSTPASSPEASGEPFTLHLPFNPFGQPVNTDPHRAVNWGPFWVMIPYAWSSLLRFDENGAVEADLAESVEPNADGSVYTAILREGIAFADGTPITADHVIASWRRALDSTALSPMYRFMEPVVGAAELANGENVPLGVTATDERTLEISLTAPLAHFPSYLATFGFAVVHPEIDNQSEPLPPGAANSGPWKITSESATEIMMVPNEHHWSEPSADITAIVWQIAPSGNTDQAILEWYQDDQIAVADAPPSVQMTLGDLASELQQWELHSSTKVLALDFHQAPFNDVRARRAVAAAINREIWATEIQQHMYLPATSFTPTVLATIANYEAPAVDVEGDPAALLEEAGINTAETENEVIFFQPATDSMEEMERTAALITMISDATGLLITQDTDLTREQITAARQDAGGLQMATLQWQLDSDQPSLLSLFTPDSTYNNGWINWEPNLEDSGEYTPGADAATYGELIAEATATLDEAARNALYAEAEALLLKNAVVIPLGYRQPAWLKKSWLVGTRQGPWSGSTPVRIDAEVTVDRTTLPATPQASPNA